MKRITSRLWSAIKTQPVFGEIDARWETDEQKFLQVDYQGNWYWVALQEFKGITTLELYDNEDRLVAKIPTNYDKIVRTLGTLERLIVKLETQTK